MPTVHLIAPSGFDHGDRPSGGNHYDRRLWSGLTAAGWMVQVHTAPPAWPDADSAALAHLARIVAGLADESLVLIDGLLAIPAARQVLPHLQRLRAVVLLHMPLATAHDETVDAKLYSAEGAVLDASAGVVVTSEWTRQLLIRVYSIESDRLHVARPGTDPAPPAGRAADRTGSRLLTVATIEPHKGQDVLVEALGRVVDLDWTCTLIGPLDRNEAFVRQLERRIAELGLGSRIELGGIRSGPALHGAYAGADLLLAPSRRETYGMVVTEALARGIPVIAADVGGLPEALGWTPDGIRPGRLVGSHDPMEWAEVIRAWLGDSDSREQMWAAAARRRPMLPGWDHAVRGVEAALQSALQAI